MSVVFLDGSYGEGGGQIVRFALVFSLLTGRPFRIVNIRRGRRNPGLKPQHLHILKTLQKLAPGSRTEPENLQVGTTALAFFPAEPKEGTFTVDFKTAGSIPLFLQTLLPACVLSRRGCRLHITGGTDVPFSMTWDFWEHVVVPYARPLTEHLALRVEARGYYPAGGGRVHLEVQPLQPGAPLPDRIQRLRALGPLMLPPQNRQRHPAVLWIQSSRSLEPRRVRQRIQRGAVPALETLGLQLSLRGRAWPTRSPGCSTTLVLGPPEQPAGVDQLCQRGVPAEEIGRRLAHKAQAFLESGDAVDPHLQDNLVWILALRGGRMAVQALTSHTRTALWTAQQFLPVRFLHREGWLVAEVQDSPVP